MTARDDRTYDVVLLGATGFAGRLTAQHLASRLPADARWAIAGRDEARLGEVRDALSLGAATAPDVLVADSGERDSIQRLAAATRVVATTVGPYLEYGEPVVAACAEAGTDYVDLTGEPEFIDRMWLAHHATAVLSGARIVHACGFDSVPHDLGAYFTVQQLPAGVPITVSGVVRTNASLSGGTFHSALGQFARAKQMRAAMAQRRAAEPRPTGRRARAASGKVHRDADLGLWLVPLPTVDPFVVARSAAALESYGPAFTYSHFAGLRKLRTLAGAGVGLGGLMVAAQIPPLRRAVASRIPAGTGPSQSRRDKSWFTVDFIGEGGGKRVHTQVRGGDPGYTETAVMLGESAMSLAYDDNPATSGQVTTAVAMGEHLLRRLQDAGISFTVLDAG